MPIKDPDAETWFDRAESFLYSSGTLNPKGADAGLHALPEIVLRAFSAECYLKCLIALEGNPVPRTHNLLHLFDELSLGAKKLITKEWEGKYMPQFKSLRREPSRPKALKVPKSLRAALAHSAMSFVEWRYAGKGSEILFTLGAFPYYVREAILVAAPNYQARAIRFELG